MLTGRDIFTGASNYSVNTERRIKNLERLSSVERIETEPIENSQTVLYKIEELKSRLNNGNILDKEKSDGSYHGDYSR